MTSVPTSATSAAPATRLGAQAIADLLAERLEGDVVEASVAFEQATVTVAASALPRAARLCKFDPALAMDFFDMMSGVDLAEEGFAVVTRLYSTVHRHEVLLRAVCEGGRKQPRLPTLTGIYRGASWHEREAYDMFGITFDGHPDLLPRILTAEGFEGWPLRKEFLLTTREVKPWPGNKEPKEAEPEGEGESAGPSAEEKAAAAEAKAERAKKKAAEMRAKKKAEREQQQGGSDE